MNIKGIGTCAVSLVASLALTACGGGGGGGSSANPASTPSNTVLSTLSFPVSGTATAFRQSSSTFNMSGVDTKNNSVSFTLSTTPGASTTFEGTSVEVSVSKFTSMKMNNVAGSDFTATNYFHSSPYIDIGELDSDGTYYVDDVSTPDYLPSTGKVGDGGALNQTNVYTDSTKSTKSEIIYSQWALEADTATTAYLCFYDNHVPVPNDGSGYTESDCLRINSAGTVLGRKITDLNADGSKLTLFSN